MTEIVDNPMYSGLRLLLRCSAAQCPETDLIKFKFDMTRIVSHLEHHKHIVKTIVLIQAPAQPIHLPLDVPDLTLRVCETLPGGLLRCLDELLGQVVIVRLGLRLLFSLHGLLVLFVADVLLLLLIIVLVLDGSGGAACSWDSLASQG